MAAQGNVCVNSLYLQINKKQRPARMPRKEQDKFILTHSTKSLFIPVTHILEKFNKYNWNKIYKIMGLTI